MKQGLKCHEKWFQTIGKMQGWHAHGQCIKACKGGLHDSYAKKNMNDPNDQKQALDTLK